MRKYYFLIFLVVSSESMGEHDFRDENRYQKRKASFSDPNNYEKFAQEITGDQDRQDGKDKLFLTPSSRKQTATSIAQKAAAEAKAAVDAQSMAGQQASQQVKTQLAEKALQAAKTAEVALAGKQTMVEQLEQEIRDAEAVVKDEGASLEQAENNKKAAMEASRNAAMLLRNLNQATQVAETVVRNSEFAYQGAQQEFTDKTILLKAAKDRVEQLLKRLSSARVDFSQTKHAAYRASTAAHEAKVNASRSKRMLAYKNEIVNCP